MKLLEPTAAPAPAPRSSTYGRGTGRNKRDGEMSSLEQDFATWLQSDPSVVWWRFEPLGLRLAKGSTYNPDFMVMHQGGELVLYEVKGYWGTNSQSRTKLKVAAEMFPLRFVGVTRDRKTKLWVFEEFS